MNYCTRFFIKTAIIIIMSVCIPSVSPAADIKILSKGLYQLVPSQDDNNFNKYILALKEYAHLEDTVDIEAVKGTSFGFEFILNDETPVSTVLKITHPKIIATSGIGYTTIHTFPVILQPDKKYFAGWNFSEDYELQAGKWIFEFDLPQSPACEFTVTQVEELVYDGNELKGITEVQEEQLAGKVIEESSPAATVAAVAPAPVINHPDQAPKNTEGETLTRYLVRGGIYPTLEEAKASAVNIKSRGFEPFIFVRERTGRSYWYYLFIRMFDSEQEATDFATAYRQEFRRKAIPQKVQVKLAPMPD